ncbi:MAG: 3-oxo-5-alpha-steroid 4-dehydrogenase [Pseudomonadales bacterium]|nr:3-oxo-5-alpha-steroid 4-dehydrogenase [Pseudomonadales bacterium]
MDYLLQPDTYNLVLKIAFGYVALIVIGGFIMQAPYGKLSKGDVGFNFSPKWGWFLMELPATLSFLIFYFAGQHSLQAVPLFFLGIWLIHYGNRGFVFPMLMRVAKGAKGSFSVMIVVAGWFVTALHGYLNAVFIAELSDQFTLDWFTDPRFIIGMLIYFIGYFGNLHSDAIIRNLRSKQEVASGEKVYRIPEGGLFKYVTNASYFTEIISFTGFAIATWNLGAVFVLLVTMANLIPRAFQQHQWYKQKFGEQYPASRKVIIPFIL